MSPRERLWERVQAALDAREDPLGDVEVQALLATHPDELEVVLRVVDAAHGVAKAAPANLRRRRARRNVVLLALGCAAAVAILLAAWPKSPRRVELVLPETGVCAGPGLKAAGTASTTSGCCGGPEIADASACCVEDEVAKASGDAGCGCAAPNLTSGATAKDTCCAPSR